MSYQVLYRKYRPRDFSAVVGQDHIVSVIRRQVESGRIAHAYLFSGPRGIGKTTVARLIAKAANCSGLDRPCNACSSCEVFNRGQALNLIEIDAASNRGIDEIRQLREAVRFSPAEGRYKVYIIDEVHQMTREAFNALLKTLEEPPPHAVFILATTELEKVPPTIVSRTQAFDFRRPRREVIGRRLLEIAKGEGVRLDAEAADTIAFAAEGSVRDAESLLGKIMAVEDKNISASSVEEILGIPQREALLKLFARIGQKQLKEAIELVNRLYQDGYDMEYLTKVLIGFFREALLVKLDPGRNSSAAQPRVEEHRDLEAHLGAYSTAELASAITQLIEALAVSRRSPIPQLPLELALISVIHGPTPA